MSASGASFSFGSFEITAKNHSPGGHGANNHSRRKFVARTTRKPTVSGSSDADFSSKFSQNCFVFGDISSWPPVTKSNNDDAQSEKLQSGNAEQKGISISTAMDAFVLSDIEENTQESPKHSRVIGSRILKGITQSPHFYPLRTHSNCARTLLISVWDRIFEEAFEQIQSLKANDVWIRCRELWKTMEELQSLGYNVIPLRRRIVELSDLTRDLKLCILGIKRLKLKAENHRTEKSRLEFEIFKLQNMARKEEEKRNRAMDEVQEIEKELPKIDAVFAKILREPLNL
ncbi:hypothetical protein M5689_002087 [Euphorbia peplus]|nr:hypothetical protein M5689_002087 [Euphorbia peplus]